MNEPSNYTLNFLITKYLPALKRLGRLPIEVVNNFTVSLKTNYNLYTIGRTIKCRVVSC